MPELEGRRQRRDEQPSGDSHDQPIVASCDRLAERLNGAAVGVL
jgi:hypothetical protein